MKIPLRAGKDYTLFLSDSLSKIKYWAVICKVLAQISVRQTNKKKSTCTTVQGHQQGTYVNPERHSDMPVQETNLLFKAETSTPTTSGAPEKQGRILPSMQS